MKLTPESIVLLIVTLALFGLPVWANLAARLSGKRQAPETKPVDRDARPPEA